MTMAQVMLLDLLIERIVSLTVGLQKVKSMTPEEVEAKIVELRALKQEQMDRIDSH